ncbi:MAG: NAD(P)H-hydrate dehydratase [Clostridia bacterium]|nr:NAD(P)H-hydrate dehydratase [Clostridia bacterium]
MRNIQDIVVSLANRPPDSHKGTYGTVLAVCGSYGMAGAALLCTKAALRAGAGLAVCATPCSVYPIIGGTLPEAVFVSLAETENGTVTANVSRETKRWQSKAKALVVGCGLGQGDGVQAAVLSLLDEARCPVVLDADGINAVSGHILKREHDMPPLILTPHPMEMARLLQCSVDEVQRDREGVAKRAAQQFHAVVVLKGHHTVVVAPDGTIYVNETGNAGMATAGSGDVLAGVIGGLLAQELSPFEAAAVGVYLHGAAGDVAARRTGMPCLMASDIVDGLCEVFPK